MLELILCVVLTAAAYTLIMRLQSPIMKEKVVDANQDRMEWEIRRNKNKAQRLMAVYTENEELEKMIEIWIREKKLFDVIDRN